MGLHSCIARATRACNGRLLVQACNFSSGIPSHSRSSAAPLFSNSQPSISSIWGSHLSHLSLTSRAFGTDAKPADSKKITAAQGIQIDRSTPEGEVASRRLKRASAGFRPLMHPSFLTQPCKTRADDFRRYGRSALRSGRTSGTSCAHRPKAPPGSLRFFYATVRWRRRSHCFRSSDSTVDSR